MSKLVLILGVVLAVLLYLRSPIDLLPDRLGGVGLLDDLAMLGAALWWIWRQVPGAPRPAAKVGGGDRSADPIDPWDVLGVARDASFEEIRRAYREQLSRYHPDKVESLGDELKAVAHRRTLEIRRAYEELQAIRDR